MQGAQKQTSVKSESKQKEYGFENIVCKMAAFCADLNGCDNTVPVQ